MKRKQMMISFGVYDDDVYEFMKNNANASALVRMLVRQYMNGQGISSTPMQPIQKTVDEHKEFTESTYDTITSQQDKIESDMSDDEDKIKKNRDKMRNLSL